MLNETANNQKIMITPPDINTVFKNKFDHTVIIFNHQMEYYITQFLILKNLFSKKYGKEINFPDFRRHSVYACIVYRIYQQSYIQTNLTSTTYDMNLAAIVTTFHVNSTYFFFAYILS